MKKANKQNKYLITFIFISILFLSLNSILCKLALANNYIDPFSFTFFRLLSAMLTLILLYTYKHKKILFKKNTNWITSFMLFLYTIAFSYAYINIDAGFGTLLLFGVVQLVMIISSLFYKEKLNKTKLIGIIISIAGLIYLVYPTESFEVSLSSAFLMVISGSAWAIYTVLGKKSLDALGNTTDNFIKATLFAVLFYILVPIENIFFDSKGLTLAIISGSITSALGYLIWYKVLPQIQILTAGILQLFVPIVAIILSVIFLDELLSLNLIFSTVIIIFGILITLSQKKNI